MISIRITNPSVSKRSGLSAKTGAAYCFIEQMAQAYISDSDGVVNPVDVVIPLSDESGYAAGSYQIAPDSFFVDRWGKLGFKLKLVPDDIPL